MTNSTVLILSDHSASIPLWREAFEQRGLTVIAESAPAAAHSHWLDGAPLLTVVDLSLPLADCLEICRQLRSIASAPILLLLPAAHGNEIMEAYRAGVTECLIQPASPAVILLKALAWSMRKSWNIPESPPKISRNQLSNALT
ncbi:MAG: response regulator [Chloroflexota bacterium]